MPAMRRMVLLTSGFSTLNLCSNFLLLSISEGGLGYEQDRHNRTKVTIGDLNPFYTGHYHCCLSSIEWNSDLAQGARAYRIGAAIESETIPDHNHDACSSHTPPSCYIFGLNTGSQPVALHNQCATYCLVRIENNHTAPVSMSKQ